MLQKACFCYSGVEAGLEHGLDANCAMAILQVKVDEGMAGTGGRGCLRASAGRGAVHRENQVNMWGKGKVPMWITCGG